MKRILTKVLAGLLVTTMTVGLFASCSNNGSSSDDSNSTNTSQTNGNETPLVVGYLPFSEKFSPFFGATQYDMDVANMVSVALLGVDRAGAIVEKGIDGETRSYNGTDYTYNGIADLDIDQGDQTTTYTFTLRDDVVFSDGTPLTADDAIFSMYVFCDPSYVGSTTLNALPIVGLQNYRTQTSDEVYQKYNEIFNAVHEAGQGNVASGVEDAIADQVWDIINTIWMKDVQDIVDYVTQNYAADYAQDTINKTADEVSADEGLQIALTMALWGFGSVDEANVLTASTTGATWDLAAGATPTFENLFAEVKSTYGDAAAYDAAGESAVGANVLSLANAEFVSSVGSKDESMGAAGVPNIEGIKKISDYSFSVTTNGFDATAIYTLSIIVAPLHYYGDAEKYDYENNKFGFDYGDLSSVEAKTTQPLGAGAYTFDRFENNIVYFTANENYWKGQPATKYIQFKVTQDADKIAAVGTGAVDVADPSGSLNAFKEISSYNSNSELDGETIQTSLVDNLGYGYIGLNAQNISVGGVIDSNESKALRKGLATIFAAYRDVVINSYYGDAASVINYPISNTSWAAPQKTDSGYQVAYSQTSDGNDIFTSSMTEDEKQAAALDATIEWLKVAGYTFDEASGKFTAAPDGAKLDYEIIIPAGGAGDHPTFAVLTYAKEALASIGINLIINDPADTNELWNKLDAEEQELWVAAWSATPDPDMYQLYHSSNINNAGGTDSNRYHLVDSELDSMIMEARQSADQTFRKATYKTCLDIILDWGIEIPVYQRQNCVIFSAERIDMDTITPDITTYWGWMQDIEKITMK